MQLSRQREVQAAPESAGGGGYPKWPEAASTGRRELSTVLQSFALVVTAVQLTLSLSLSLRLSLSLTLTLALALTLTLT